MLWCELSTPLMHPRNILPALINTGWLCCFAAGVAALGISMYEGTVIAMQPPPPYTVSVDDLIGKLEAVKRKIGGNAKVAIRGRGYTVPLNDQAVVVGSARTIPDNPDRLNPVLLIGK